jgi:DNA-binding XRE family transcriptional regulator
MSISGEQTKVARELLGWTKAQMALEAGATVTEITDFGTGKKRPAKR